MKDSVATKHKEPRKNLIVTNADIFDVKAEVLVNSANRQPRYGAAKDYKSLDFLVFQYAGKEDLRKERVEKGILKTGQCVMTDSYKLSERGFKYIAHVNVPSFNSNEKALFHTYYKLEEAIYNTLNQVRYKECKSVVFPVLGTGAKGFEEDDAFFCMLDTLAKFFYYNVDYDLTVYLSIKSRELYETARTMCREEYFESNISAMNMDAELNSALEKKPLGFVNEEVVLKRMKDFETRKNRAQGTPFFTPDMLRPLFEVVKDNDKLKSESHDVMHSRVRNLARKLKNLMERKKVDKNTLVEKSFISMEKLKYILAGSTNYDRSTIFGICYGLGLSYDESLDFLQYAGICIKPWDYVECIIMYGIEKRFDARKVIELLDELEMIQKEEEEGKPKEKKMTSIKEKVMKQKGSYIGDRDTAHGI